MSAVQDLNADVFVIGGGPAGSTVATLLARRGHRVTLAEKETHPRFHIGESLLPMNLPILERLGVHEEVERIGLRKRGADFTVEGSASTYQTMHFRRALEDSPPFAYEVRRSEFDGLLFANAREAGANTLEGCEVLGVDSKEAGFVIRTRGGDGHEQEWHASFVVDASGRDTFFARKHRWKERDPKHASAAIFSHFKGVRRRPGSNQGNISIYWFEHGWIWMIPLPDGVMSVGAVCNPEYLKGRRGRPAAEFLRETIKLVPDAAGRFENFDPVEPVRVTGNYSYRSSRMTGPGFVLVGDAFAFIDPVFSSGVYLAMNSAERAVPQIEAWLAKDEAAYRDAVRTFESDIARGLSTFSWFIYRFTTPGMRRLFANPRNRWRVEQGVISMLAGDVFRDNDVDSRLRIFRALYAIASALSPLTSVRSWRARRLNTRHEFG